MSHILVVDDEMDLREILQFNLQSSGFEVTAVDSAESALAALSQQDFDLLLLDVMMGGMSGLELAKQLREVHRSTVPIIFLTAKSHETDLLRGFSAGGDDYVCKPFSFQEVLARIHALLRRSQGSDNAARTSASTLSIDGLTLDFTRKMVSIKGEDVNFSPKEFGILATLMSQPKRVFSREEILAEVWKGEAFVLDRTVDVHIARVRRKLGDMGSRIVNRMGYGYSFV